MNKILLKNFMTKKGENLTKRLIYYIFGVYLIKVMKKTVLFLGLLSITILSSCKKKVTSCIEMDNSSISAGQSINFTSCSENALSLDWNITGPSTAPENSKGWSDKIITVPLTVAGSYTITLDSYSKFSFQGDKASSTASFNVN